MTKIGFKITIAGVVIAAIVAAITGLVHQVQTTAASVASQLPSISVPAVSIPTKVPDSATALARLALVSTKNRAKVAGYERGCAAGQACSFGPAWSDDTAAPGGHNGCGTRDDILAAQLTKIAKKGSCVVVSGTLSDPYTGSTIAFTKSNADAVEIDHVIPEAFAWDMGASTWTQDQRNTFANDEAVNLLAVSRAANQAKSDKGPSAYMPPNKAYGCTYATHWVDVALKYKLSITIADKTTLGAALTTCK